MVRLRFPNEKAVPRGEIITGVGIKKINVVPAATDRNKVLDADRIFLQKAMAKVKLAGLSLTFTWLD